MGSRSFICEPRTRRLAGVSLLLGLGLLIVLAGTGALGAMPPALLTLLPVFLIAGVMLARPYLGERAIARMRGRRWRRDVRPRSTSAAPARHLFERKLACGGLLIASALAGRAPPPALAGTR